MIDEKFSEREDFKESEGDGGLLRRTKGFRSDLREETNKVARFPEVVNGDEDAILGSVGVDGFLRKLRGKGG